MGRAAHDSATMEEQNKNKIREKNTITTQTKRGGKKDARRGVRQRADRRVAILAPDPQTKK
jgi:hypothetical protein